jgi:transcriptional regulator with XRE-family HTH domain
MLTAGQMRAARGLLGWSQNDLAKAAGVGLSTVKRMEASLGIVRANAGNAWKVRKAIQSAGIELIDEDGGGGPGARWKRKQQ